MKTEKFTAEEMIYFARYAKQNAHDDSLQTLLDVFKEWENKYVPAIDRLEKTNTNDRCTTDCN